MISRPQNTRQKARTSAGLPPSQAVAGLISLLSKTGRPARQWQEGVVLPALTMEEIGAGWTGLKHGWLAGRGRELILTARGAFACRAYWRKTRQKRPMTASLLHGEGPAKPRGRDLARLERVGGEELALEICAKVFKWSTRHSATLTGFCTACYQQVRRRYLGRAIVRLAMMRGWITQVMRGAQRLYVLTARGGEELRTVPLTSSHRNPGLLGDLLAGS